MDAGTPAGVAQALEDMTKHPETTGCCYERLS